jgi:hypothetical protein
MTADDILWRRSKLGLRFSEAERNTLQEWLGARSLPTPPLRAECLAPERGCTFRSGPERSSGFDV